LHTDLALFVSTVSQKPQHIQKTNTNTNTILFYFCIIYQLVSCQILAINENEYDDDK